MQKGFLIAGGLIILGFLGYTLFGKKEEEIEDAEYYIVVETKKEKDTTVEKQKKNESIASDESSLEKVSIVKSVNLPIEQDQDVEFPKQEIESTPLLKKTEEKSDQEITQMKVVSTVLEIDPQKEEIINELEVVKPQEIIVEANDNFPLKLGSKGKRIWNLKVYLMKNHGGAGIITNDFDKLTAERVRRFLKVDEVNEELYNKLNMEQRRKKKRNATKKKY